MKAVRLFALLAFVAALFAALPASAAQPSASLGIHSIAACKDVTTVVVNGTSTYSNNRLDVGVYFKDSKGKWVLLKQAFSPVFASGPFLIQVPLSYAGNAATEGETLRVDVQLQILSAGKYVNAGSLITQNVIVADKNCTDKCSVTVDTTDKAPAAGTLTLRSHFGSWFRPEGRLQGAMAVSAGQKARLVFVGVPCDWPVRVWFYPKSGDKTPKMLPAQYWPDDFQANQLDGTNPYTTAFSKGLAPTSPLEKDDPFVAK